MTKENKTISAFTDDALGTLDMVAMIEQLNNKHTTPYALVRASISRAEKANTQLNAVVIKAYDHALNDAINPTKGLLSGIPTFVKDTDDAKGLTTTIGSAAVKQKNATKDSSFVRQLRGTGLINLGKSTTPEFGLTGTTEALAYGPTLNPWNKGHTPGGSSGGACALVASGVVPIAHANDGAGSIRIPASCCGLVGLKPTRGRTAFVDGSRVLPVNILHQGVVTRSVRDTVAFYEAVETHFPNSKLSRIGQITSPSDKRLKIALLTDGADNECSAAAENAAKLLAREGHIIVPIQMPFSKQVMDDFFVLWSGMAFSLHRFGSVFIGRGFDRRKTEPLTQSLSRSFSQQILRAPSAFRRLKKFAHDYADFFKTYDCLMSPTLGHAPPEIGHLSTAEPFEVSFTRARDFFPFTPYQNISGAPAISMPAILSKKGLPIGVQFAGAWGQDKALLELAYEFEALSNWKHLYER